MPPSALLRDIGYRRQCQLVAGQLQAAHYGQVAVNQSLVAEPSQPVQGIQPAGSARVQSTARLLRALLQEREDYLEGWQSFRYRASGTGALSQAAVAHVIADHLWETGERPDTEISLPRALKDRVHRALQGEVISAETLKWFIDAFRMTPDDASRLRDALYADQPRSGIPVANTLRPPQELPIPQRHRTLAVFEHRIIGPERHAIAHRTTRAITACTDTVYSYPCRRFSTASEITMLRGGRITARHDLPGSTPILEITLSTPLLAGQITSLEYQAAFGARSGTVTEYRQVAHARADNVNLVVQFHDTRHPRKVWWVIWDDYRDGSILEQEAVSLDSDSCAHRYLTYLENAAAGFRWEW